MPRFSSTGYTGNKYFATRKRLSYHPADKQFTGSSTTTTTAPPPPASTDSEPESQSTSRGTFPAGMKPQEKKSLWKAKGADVAETYVSEEHKSLHRQNHDQDQHQVQLMVHFQQE